MMFFHPESYVPRTVRVGLSAQALGHHIDFVELDARLEGLEIILEKLFSEGYIGKDFMKRMFSIPRHKYTSEENVRTRGRRNVQNNYLEELDNQVCINLGYLPWYFELSLEDDASVHFENLHKLRTVHHLPGFDLVENSESECIRF